MDWMAERAHVPSIRVNALTGLREENTRVDVKSFIFYRLKLHSFPIIRENSFLLHKASAV